jgi:hypothetical protein
VGYRTWKMLVILWQWYLECERVISGEKYYYQSCRADDDVAGLNCLVLKCAQSSPLPAVSRMNDRWTYLWEK